MVCFRISVRVATLCVLALLHHVVQCQLLGTPTDLEAVAQTKPGGGTMVTDSGPIGSSPVPILGAVDRVGNSGEMDDNDPRCSNVDIRNNLRRLAEIENCTVIDGFLQMVLIERVPSTEFAKHQCKKLREVTGYMLFFRVINLTSLRDLFPNLMVIRGQQLIGNYALVFYYMSNMIEIGLKNLVSIERGFVYTLHCPQICHLDTIDWATITGQGNSPKNLNSFETPKAVCNKSEVCRGCEPKFCWGSQSCQKFYKGVNFNGKIKCHPQCMGGCNGTTASDCLVCRGWKERNQCVEQCSPDRLQYRHMKRCITKATCLGRGGLLHMNECVEECPAGYSATNVVQDVADFSIPRCYPCWHRCPKVCDGTEIMYLSDAERLRGCTIINGTLHIRLKEDHPNLQEELKSCLGDIEEIMGILKVFRSNFILSLEFLAGLQIIHGQHTSVKTNFSLMVYENNNLQRLWNFEYKTSLHILANGMYFSNNELLCHKHIQLLRKVAEYDNSTDTIDWGSNGHMQSCHVQHFSARFEVLSSQNVTVFWAKQSVKSPHRLLGYLIYYIRAAGEKSPYEGRDQCSKYGWRTRYVPLQNVTVQGNYFAFNLTRLAPFTRYACYVKMYYNESVNAATDLVGLSDMIYFKTTIDRPTSPLHVRTSRKNHNSITLSWKILPSEQKIVTLYHVDVFIQPDEPALLDQRNFCIHPHEPQPVDAGSVDEPEGCSKEFCCELEELEYEEEEESDHDEGVPASDEFFHEQTTQEDGGRIGGRRRKRSIVNARPARDHGDFERSMMDLLRTADTHDHSYARRTRREASNDPPEEEFVNRIINRDFVTDNYEYTVTGLEHFTRYIFQLFACYRNETVNCSSYSLYTDRTEPLPDGDQLNFTILTGAPGEPGQPDEDAAIAANIRTTYGNRIVLHFPEPTEANGLTVAYNVEVEYVNGTYVKRWSSCITRLEHERHKHRYTIDHASPGEYMVRAQAVSLSGPGPFSQWSLMRILPSGPTVRPEQGNTSLRDGLISCAVLVLLGAIGAGTVFLVRRRRRQGAARRDDKLPLTENDGNQMHMEDGFVNCPLK